MLLDQLKTAAQQALAADDARRDHEAPRLKPHVGQATRKESKIFRAKPRASCDPGEHLGTELVGVVEGVDEVRPSFARASDASPTVA